MKRPAGRHQKFWNKEYRKPGHLALSTAPSEDLQKFTRWLGRQDGRAILHQNARVLDLGCGNGRNLIWLAKEFGVKGVGYDISAEAISQAKKAAAGLPLEFATRALSESISLEDESVNLVLDMMSSHVLRQAEREKFRDEILRVLKPGGFFFFKTFLLEEDGHAERLLREHPAPPEDGQAPEPHSYIHPEFGHFEHVWTISEIEEFFSPHFEIHKILKSHKHLKRPRLRQGYVGQSVPFRRRTVSVYLEKLG